MLEATLPGQGLEAKISLSCSRRSEKTLGKGGVREGKMVGNKVGGMY